MYIQACRVLPKWTDCPAWACQKSCVLSSGKENILFSLHFGICLFRLWSHQQSLSHYDKFGHLESGPWASKLSLAAVAKTQLLPTESGPEVTWQRLQGLQRACAKSCSCQWQSLSWCLPSFSLSSGTFWVQVLAPAPIWTLAQVTPVKNTRVSSVCSYPQFKASVPDILQEKKEKKENHNA